MSQLYSYRARSPKGMPHRGVLKAVNENEALRFLQERGLVVTKLELSRDLAEQWRAGKGLGSIFKRQVAVRDLSLFCRQFAVLFSSGVPVVQSLRTLQDQTSSKELKAALKQATQAVVAGESLGGAMKRDPGVFPALLYNMVAAGEVSGSLETVLVRAAAHFEREHEINSRVKSALFYPKLVVGVIFLVVIFLLSFVVPRFAEFFAGMGIELPLPTRILIWLGTFMGQWWWAVLLVLLVLYGIFTWYSFTPHGARVMDKVALRAPVFGQLTRMNLISRFCRNLATLSRSGVPIVPAMMLVRQTLGNRIFEDALRPVEDAIRAGQSIASQLGKSGYFPPLVTQMVAVGEETGALDSMLERSSDFFDTEIKDMTNRLTQLIEPLVFVFLGVIVAFIILSIMMPMFDTFGAIGG